VADCVRRCLAQHRGHGFLAMIKGRRVSKPESDGASRKLLTPGLVSRVARHINDRDLIRGPPTPPTRTEKPSRTPFSPPDPGKWRGLGFRLRRPGETGTRNRRAAGRDCARTRSQKAARVGYTVSAEPVSSLGATVVRMTRLFIDTSPWGAARLCGRTASVSRTWRRGFARREFRSSFSQPM
jgi:hypothetical protein